MTESGTQEFEIIVNDQRMRVETHAERTLLDLLREDLGLTGTKRGCGVGACGSCTVLIDGKARRSCKIKISDLRVTSHESPAYAEASAGKRITTIEGLADGTKLHPIQQAFIDCGAIQCGFCTPGMVLAAKALLDVNPDPTMDEIKKALAPNLCRCTGYQQIFHAVEKAARLMR